MTIPVCARPFGFRLPTPASQLSGEWPFHLTSEIGCPQRGGPRSHPVSVCVSGPSYKGEDNLSCKRGLVGEGCKKIRSKRVGKKKWVGEMVRVGYKKMGRGGGGEGRGMTAQFPKIAHLLYHWSGNVTLWRPAFKLMQTVWLAKTRRSWWWQSRWSCSMC
jgi:hypothetical protein